MTDLNAERIRGILGEVLKERRRQHRQWGEQRLPDGTGGARRQGYARDAKYRCDVFADHGTLTFLHVLSEEIAEAFAESDPARLRAELIQVAAVCVQWVEDLDRRASEEES